MVNNVKSIIITIQIGPTILLATFKSNWVTRRPSW